MVSVLLSPPPFDDWAASTAWEEALIRDGVPLTSIAEMFVGLDRPVPLTRAAILLNRLRDEAGRDLALQRAQAKTSTWLERLYVFAVAYATRRGRTMLLSDDQDMTYGDLLEQYLQQLRTSPPIDAEVSRAEVEYRLLEALHYDSMAGGRTSQAVVTAKEMVLLATVAQVPDIVERARRYYRSAIAHAGRYHEDLTERLRALQLLTATDMAYERERKGLVIAQLNVGDLNGALITAQDDPPLQLHTAIVNAMRGIFHLSGNVAWVEEKTIGWIALCLWHLANIEAVPPWRTDERRSQALVALEIIHTEQWRTSATDRPFLIWLQARCRMHLGEFGLARQSIKDLPELEREDLLSRLLLAGLRLDLALTDEVFQVQLITRSEEELRGIFGDARGLRYGSASGLAEVLLRWHPRSAAYMALCPEAVPELFTATQAVMQCQQRVEVYGLTLPPTTAIEESLRAFGEFPASLPLGSNARFQRQKLMVMAGDVEYWRPLVLAVHLILGLCRAGTPSHRDTAERLLRDYGVMPRQPGATVAAEELRTLLKDRLDGSCLKMLSIAL